MVMACLEGPVRTLTMKNHTGHCTTFGTGGSRKRRSEHDEPSEKKAAKRDLQGSTPCQAPSLAQQALPRAIGCYSSDRLAGEALQGPERAEGPAACLAASDEADLESQRSSSSPSASAADQIVDVYGNVHPAVATDTFDCFHCGRSVTAGRFAPHLERCLGKGRLASRQASRAVSAALGVYKKQRAHLHLPGSGSFAQTAPVSSEAHVSLKHPVQAPSSLFEDFHERFSAPSHAKRTAYRKSQKKSVASHPGELTELPAVPLNEGIDFALVTKNFEAGVSPSLGICTAAGVVAGLHDSPVTTSDQSHRQPSAEDSHSVPGQRSALADGCASRSAGGGVLLGPSEVLKAALDALKQGVEPVDFQLHCAMGEDSLVSSSPEASSSEEDILPDFGSQLWGDATLASSLSDESLTGCRSPASLSPCSNTSRLESVVARTSTCSFHPRSGLDSLILPGACLPATVPTRKRCGQPEPFLTGSLVRRMRSKRNVVAGS